MYVAGGCFIQDYRIPTWWLKYMEAEQDKLSSAEGWHIVMAEIFDCGLKRIIIK